MVRLTGERLRGYHNNTLRDGGMKIWMERGFEDGEREDEDRTRRRLDGFPLLLDRIVARACINMIHSCRS